MSILVLFLCLRWFLSSLSLELRFLLFGAPLFSLGLKVSIHFTCRSPIRSRKKYVFKFTMVDRARRKEKRGNVRCSNWGRGGFQCQLVFEMLVCVFFVIPKSPAGRDFPCTRCRRPGRGCCRHPPRCNLGFCLYPPWCLLSNLTSSAGPGNPEQRLSERTGPSLGCFLGC